MLPKELSDFLTQHWVLGGVLASLAWFVAGKQSLSNGKPDFAIFWQSVAAVIALVVCGWAVAREEWVGLLVGALVLGFELRSLFRIPSAKARDR